MLYNLSIFIDIIIIRDQRSQRNLIYHPSPIEPPMLLRNTKKFFQKTLNSLKSLFSSSDYQRIPKNILTTYTDHFTNKWDSSSANKEEMKVKPIRKRSNKKNVMKQENSKEVHQNGSFMKFVKSSQTKHVHADSRFISAASNMRSEERNYYLLTEMLKELEMMDMSNVDHVLDIEEFLHYYSRLTCPVYIDIVDKFFLDIYAEFFGSSATPAYIISSIKA